MHLKKHLIFLACLLALAVGLALTLTWLGRSPAPEGPALSGPVETGSVSVYALPQAVRSVSVEQREGDRYTLECHSPENRVETATLAGFEPTLVDSSRVAGVLTASQSLEATHLLEEEPGDLALYGLEDPRARVEIADLAGNRITLLAGDTAPGNTGIYCRLEGESPVWLVPVYELNNFLSPKTAYLNRTITDGSVSSSRFAKITLGGSVREELGEITVEWDEGTGEYALSAPCAQPLDIASGLPILRALFGLQADSIAAVYPTNLELASLGLDEPYATAEIDGEHGHYKLYATAPDLGGSVYIYREDIPLLYLSRAELLPWLAVQYTDLMDPFAFTPDIDRLSRVEVAEGDAVYDFAVEAIPGENSTRLRVTVGDIPLDGDNFRRFYITLISARLLEHTDEAPGAGVQPTLTFTYRYRSGEEHAVRFYPGPARRCYIQVDEGRFFLTSSAYVDRVAADLGKVLAGEEVESYFD